MASPRGCHATMILLMASTLFVSCTTHRQLERQARQVEGQFLQLKGITDIPNG